MCRQNMKLSCPECDHEVETTRGLTMHMAKCCPDKSVKEVLAGLTFSCDGCQQKFRNQDHLYRHRKHICKARVQVQAVVDVTTVAPTVVDVAPTAVIVAAVTPSVTAVSPQTTTTVSPQTTIDASSAPMVNSQNTAMSVDQAKNLIKECEQVIQRQQNQVNTNLNAYLARGTDYVAELVKLHGMTPQTATQYILNKIQSGQTFDICKKVHLNGPPEEWAIVVEDAKKKQIYIKMPDGSKQQDFGGDLFFKRVHDNTRNVGLKVSTTDIETKLLDKNVGAPDYETRTALVFNDLQMDKLMEYAVNGGGPKEQAKFMKQLTDYCHMYS